MLWQALELDRRLAVAEEARRRLRRATLEWARLGREVMEARERGPRRPDDRNTRRRIGV